LILKPLPPCLEYQFVLVAKERPDHDGMIE
jgi:hypothetical protein